MKKKASVNKISAFPKIATFKGGILGQGAKMVTASTNMDSTSTFYYSPELTPTAWLLPKSRIETCLIAGTPVFTDYTIKNIEDIVTDTCIFSEHGEISKAYNPHVSDHEGDILKIKPYLLPSIECTPDHRILRVKSERCSWKGKFLCKPNCLVQKSGCKKKYTNYVPEWVEAKDLLEDDFVLFPKYRVYKNIETFDLSKYIESSTFNRWELTDTSLRYKMSDLTLNRYIKPSKELFRLFGWYFAEGSCGNGIRFALSANELHIAEYIIKKLKEIFNVDSYIVYNREKTGISIVANSLILARFFTELFNRGAGNKEIPEFIVKAPDDLIKEFLLGWAGGDGTFNVRDNRLQISTASKNAAYQSLLLCSKLGFLPSLHINGKKGSKKVIKGKETKFNYDHYIISITADGLKILGLPSTKREHTKAYYQDSEYFYLPIRSIESYKFSGKVYDIASTNDTFVTTFIVHNCKWIRIYFNMDPYIRSITTMHAKYPSSTFELESKHTEALQLFNKAMFHHGIDWFEWMYQGLLSYNKFGEAICWGNWDNELKRWNSFTWVDPDIVEVQQDPFTVGAQIELIPTMEIKKLVRDAMLGERKNVPQVIIDNVMNNRRIPLDANGQDEDIFGNEYEPAKVFMFIDKSDPGAIRGTSRITALFSDMIYKDKIKLAQIAIADRHHLPIELWTLGHLTGDMQSSMLPSDEDLSNMREMIKMATSQPPFSIVATPLLKYEALGVSGKLLSVYEDLGYVENQILVGLGANKDLILGGGSSFSNSKTLALHRLIMEYQTTRDLFTNWMKKYILLPIAKAHKLKDDEGNYIIPEIKWKKSLRPEQDKELFDMFFKMWKEGLVSTKTLYTKFPEHLNYEQQEAELEAERETVFNKGDKRLPKQLGGETPTPAPKGLGEAPSKTTTPSEPKAPSESKEEAAERMKERREVGESGKNQPLEEMQGDVDLPEGTEEI